MKFLTVLHAVILWSLAYSCPGETIDVYILAGQSNMGDGGVTQYHDNGQTIYTTIPELRLPQESIYQFKMRNGGEYTSNNWQQLQPNGNYFGPELSFGYALSTRDAPVAIIKTAANGTNLAEDWDVTPAPGSQGLYDWMMTKVTSSLQQLPAQYTPHLAGFVWVQGEGDAAVQMRAASYKANLLAFADKLRTDLGVPDLPFAFNQGHAGMARSFVNILRQQQYEASLAPNMHMINVDDLGLRVDQVHFDAYTHLEVGKRFADLFHPYADLNEDLSIDGSDLALWKSSMGATNRLGDTNADAIVDGTDFLLWQRQVGSSSASLGTLIPEPTAFALALALGLLFLAPNQRLPT